MTIEADIWERLVAKMHAISDDFPVSNLILIREPEGVPPWGAMLPELGPEHVVPRPDLPTVGIALPGDIYDAVSDADMDRVATCFDQICARPCIASPEDELAFRVAAKAAIQETLRRGSGEVWVCSAGTPLGERVAPLPFSMERDDRGDCWIAVPPRWLATERLSFDWQDLMNQMGEAVLNERAQAALLN